MISALKQTLRRVALNTGLAGLAARGAKGVRMLMHHGVSGAFGPERLEEQIIWIKARCPILPFGEVATRLRDERPLPDLAVVLTFDDGLRNNVTQAYPVLLKHQVPATFFVCPGLIDTGGWVWTYEVRERLKGLAKEELQSLAGKPLETVDQVVSWMKKQPNAQRVQMLEAIRSATPGFQVTETMRRDYDLASWEELAKLDRRLITLGSHTMSHPILSSLPPDELESDLKTSKEALVAKGLSAADETFFCYPDGNHNDAVVACAAKHYAAACSTRKGFITAASPLMAMPRIGATGSLEDVAWRMWRPGA